MFRWLRGIVKKGGRSPSGRMTRGKRKPACDLAGRSLDENVSAVRETFHWPRNASLSIREFDLRHGGRRVRAAALFLNDIVDARAIEDTILKPLFRLRDIDPPARGTPDTIIGSVPGARVTRAATHSEIAEGLVGGSTALMVDGEAGGYMWETRQSEHRAIEESPAEAVVRGPHFGFVEDDRTNTALIRLYLATPDLVTERIRVGRRSNAPFTIAYLDGVADPGLVQDVMERVRSVKADFVPSVDMLESFIEDEPNNPLPSILITERPDRVASMLAEGHVAVISASAGVGVVPTTIWDLMHSPEDHYLHYIPASVVRLIRWLAVFTTLYSSALYVAVTNYHPEMIPTELLSAIASAREAVPFPAVLEVLTMEVALELIREASARIPTIFGPTIGIVGAVVLGQAAVMANIVNPILVVVVAISGLGSFAVPNYELGVALRLLKFLMICAAAVAGIPSITAASVLLLARLCVTRSFGVPVTAPVVPHHRHAPRHRSPRPRLGDGGAAGPLAAGGSQETAPSFEAGPDQGRPEGCRGSGRGRQPVNGRARARPGAGGSIGRVEAVILLATFTALKVFLGAPERITKHGQTAAWALPALSALFSLFWLLPLVSVLNAHPGMDIIEITRRVAGNGVALLAGTTYYSLLAGILATGARQVASALAAVTLPTTPLYFLLAVGYAVILCVPLWGLESLARATLIGGVYSYSMVALLPAITIVPSYFVAPHKMDYIFPLLGPGVVNMLKAGLIEQSAYFELLALGLLAPHIRERRGTGKVAWISLGLSAFAMSSVVLALSMVFPYPSLARVSFPHLRGTRIIGVGRFFQRLDALFVADWLTASLLGGATGIYVSGLAMASTLHLYHRMPMLLCLSATIAVLAAYWIPSLSVVFIAEYDVLRPAATVLLDVWPASIFLLHKLRRAKNPGGGRPK